MFTMWQVMQMISAVFFGIMLSVWMLWCFKQLSSKTPDDAPAILVLQVAVIVLMCMVPVLINEQ